MAGLWSSQSAETGFLNPLLMHKPKVLQCNLFNVPTVTTGCADIRAVAYILTVTEPILKIFGKYIMKKLAYLIAIPKVNHLLTHSPVKLLGIN